MPLLSWETLLRNRKKQISTVILTQVSPSWAASQRPRTLECYWGRGVGRGKRLQRSAAQGSLLPGGWSSGSGTPGWGCWTLFYWSKNKTIMFCLYCLQYSEKNFNRKLEDYVTFWLTVQLQVISGHQTFYLITPVQVFLLFQAHLLETSTG